MAAGRSDDFSFRVGGVKLGPLTVGDGMCGVDLGVRVENLESSYALVIPSKIVGFQQQGPIVAATPSNAVLLRPCGGYELTWPRETSVLSVTVDRAVLENEVGSSSALRAGHPGIDLTTPLARGWLSLVRVLLREVDDPHSRVRQPDMARRWSQLVVNGLAILLDEPHQEERVRRTRLLRPRPVKHALDVMHANPAHPFTLAELARAAGVGPRTLQHAFHRYVGMSPLSYLRDLRPSQAHDDLGQADPRETSVGEIAYRCGFTTSAGSPGSTAPDTASARHRHCTAAVCSSPPTVGVERRRLLPAGAAAGGAGWAHVRTRQPAAAMPPFRPKCY